ncbi:hypothetical protein [Frankia sp. EI5c]|uniref:hypothetical protein n=1 Tax=Frankia sp. EI5c TaxID=683316 RepID=UPI001F5BC67E|nr:hypothetical protein [Frankia sp. EI5c]
MPNLLGPLLSGASMTHVDFALGMHGHQIGWDFAEETDSFAPLVRDVPAVPLVLVGHTHRRAVFEVRRSGERGEGGCGVPGTARGRVPGEGDQLGTVRSVPVVPGVPVAVPVRSAGPELVTTVVNVGPAVGRPSNWLFFDADRGEVVFQEA